ncbi:hypothetical protein COCVIDRAFT_116389, partial [Bipolaris victoriae FI3]
TTTTTTTSPPPSPPSPSPCCASAWASLGCLGCKQKKRPNTTPGAVTLFRCFGPPVPRSP